jgi:hypothetical protein
VMTSGKPLAYPQIYYAFDIVRQIGLACGKEAARRIQGAKVRGAKRIVGARAPSNP